MPHPLHPHLHAQEIFALLPPDVLAPPAATLVVTAGRAVRAAPKPFDPVREVIRNWEDRPVSLVCAVLQALVEAQPEILSRAAATRGPRGGASEPVLFYALGANAPAALISTLLDLGESAAALNATGATPLHVALREVVSTDCVLALLRANPAAALVEDERGRTPLHAFAFSFKRSYGRRSAGLNEAARLEIAERVLAAAPSAVSVFDSEKNTPLSLAVMHDAPLSIISLLLSAVPRSSLREHIRETGITNLPRVAEDSTIRALFDGAIAEAARCSDRDGGADLGGTGALEGE